MQIGPEWNVNQLRLHPSPPPSTVEFSFFFHTPAINDVPDDTVTISSRDLGPKKRPQPPLWGATREARGKHGLADESSSKHVLLGIELRPVDLWLQNHIPHQVFTLVKTGMWEWPSVSYPEWRVVE
ncbi:hypothetical protein K0M31_006588 [Melipona bicolor]|uniref:Uncharacterized protein n=1 Tax=Melipona bicolor TaxID=60889 RepID=A0AA40FRW9_9HYME|nr:hypothetical protein K0M31_006588 [Melipona bicolor]